MGLTIKRIDVPETICKCGNPYANLPDYPRPLPSEVFCKNCGGYMTFKHLESKSVDNIKIEVSYGKNS